MSLYGIDDKKPTKQDMHGTEARAMQKQSKAKKSAYPSPQLSPYTSNKKIDSDFNSGISNSEDILDEILDVNISYADQNPSNTYKGENIKAFSGKKMAKHDLPIKIDSKCLSHQNGKDSQLTLNLFKMACLTYKPSQVNYREQNFDRKLLIQIRRGLIDKLQVLIQNSWLFVDNAFFPRRYFDDLMIEEQKITREIKGTMPKILDSEHVSRSVLPPLLNVESTNFLPGPPFLANPRNLALLEHDMTLSNTVSNNKLLMNENLSPNQNRKLHNQSMTIDVTGSSFSRNGLMNGTNNKRMFVPAINSTSNRASSFLQNDLHVPQMQMNSTIFDQSPNQLKLRKEKLMQSQNSVQSHESSMNVTRNHSWLPANTQIEFFQPKAPVRNKWKNVQTNRSTNISQSHSEC